MNNSKVKLTESQLHNVIKESVKKILSELDWKTYMNASRKRQQNADDVRASLRKSFPNSMIAYKRNSYDDKSDELEKFAQQRYQDDFTKTHSSEKDGWWDGEQAHIKHTRKGSGMPFKNHGHIYDETFDDAIGDGFTGDRHRKWTLHVDKDGTKYDPNFSTVGNEVSHSKDHDYNRALDNMTNDMKNYYQGKSKYTKGKGWD